MGEIKSTLDIIMEKTNGLTMSEEEKKVFKEREISGKVKGLIHKYLDGILDLHKLKMELAALAEQEEDMVKVMIGEESISRIEIGEDNESVLRILEETAGLDTKFIREVLKDFGMRLEHKKTARQKGMLNSLEEKGISGSAVIPNIKTDPEWDRYVSGLKKGLQDQLSLFIEEIKSS